MKHFLSVSSCSSEELFELLALSKELKKLYKSGGEDLSCKGKTLAMLFEKPVMIIMDPDHPEQQNNAKKIVDMGAGTSVNGKLVTHDLLEKKIAETMACCPRPIRAVHQLIKGRENAAAIIIDVANRGEN